MSPPFLPYGRQLIEDDDLAAVARVLQGDFLTTGPEVAAFEADLAARCDAPHAVACANGTAALHLAALAMGLGPGDAAIVPSLTFLATANCARYVGAEVVFADVDPVTGLMGPDHLEQALSRVGSLTPRAVLPVHLNGQCVDLEAMAPLVARHNLAVIEDGCHALGARQRRGTDWDAAGSCRQSTMAVFSFHPVKTVAMGEGGAVTTRDEPLAARLKLLRSHGMSKDAGAFLCPDQAFDSDGQANPWYYEMAAPGFNYRASDINCALGRSQLAKLDRFTAERARLHGLYQQRLAGLAPLVRLLPEVPWSKPSWHIQVVHIDFAAAGTSRAQVMRALAADGIGTQVHYLPVHRQPYYRQRTGLLSLPGADAYYSGCLTLPLFVGMTDDDVARVVSSLARILGGTS
ncbi:DegT/DnrJ/EryC1/StrS aminotransferase [Magnetospirillum sp. LM-5]|uniref:UDP-4-amino-4, 6-dideoxy-N-acetyl-beta-L-altrosamine transaminase n=1 Tax=Magnetospirillum sp. LM-5 TaxID=2681466 RepID=UPI0013846F04|nr:UDP-4-amino-4,6-dideoxy-N-acetyl-beta-L-altrosamine transaminase [Magnetospirillum sp. LM-5]CAA7615966.1 DegT/DnrJ/EryC1/StrS aminotransferase [Magnetospirillum sp. LM-5]